MATVDVQVGASNGDGYRRTGGANFSILGISVVVGDYSVTYYDSIGFLLFPSVAVPAGATITVAYISVYAYQEQSAYPTLRIQAEDVDNPAGIADAAAFDARYPTRTTAYTDWTLTDFNPNTWYNSDSIVAVIQEIVDRGGWATGQNMMIFLSKTPYGYSERNQQEFRSWDWDPDYAAKLHVEYEEGGGAVAMEGNAASLVANGEL